ncbi:MAG: hypothetical protein AAGJ74_16645 [Pseudomonadota bacterium]
MKRSLETDVIDVNAIEANARRLRAQAFAAGMASARDWVVGHLPGGRRHTV